MFSERGWMVVRGVVSRERIAELFGASAAKIDTQTSNFVFRYRSAQHFADVFFTYYGPTLKALAALDEAQGKALVADIINLVGRFNRATDGTVVVPSEYLEVVVTKR